MGVLARRIGQPPVVGEIIAGVVLGPSLLGWLLPGVQGYLFPKASMGIIYTLSQVGLVLYMFLIGLEFQHDLFRKRVRSAISVSMAGIVAPLALGALIALYLHGQPGFFVPGVASWVAMLFLGAAMSITAFPVLARIIADCGLTGTALGTLALAAGAVDDGAAWCLLAIALASISGQPVIAAAAIGGGVLYTLCMLIIARPLWARLGRWAEGEDGVSASLLSVILVLLMICAWFTDAIGIYAVFGAFILGVALPRGTLTRELQRMMGPLTSVFLLPLYFVYSGLNTRLGAVDTVRLWAIVGVVLLAACLGKGVACWLAARANGEERRDAMAIGTLMNARGLMELVILNIGLERGLITTTLFTIMVLMAIVTTFLATPLFELVYRRSRAGEEAGHDGLYAPEDR
jgi:Kef-type K+ transport system membrane component KefB